MKHPVFLPGAAISLLILSACSSDENDPAVDFGIPPPASMVTSGTVEVLDEGSSRYHVLVFGELVTSTIVETESGSIIVDVAFGLIPESGTQLRAYADALGKPIDVVITHAHLDHFGNIASFADTNVYAETENAALLLADMSFTGLYSGTVNAVSGTIQLAGIDVVFDNISNTEATENGYISIPGDNTLFLGDLIFNQSHAFIRDYTPLDDTDELDFWIAGLNDIQDNFGNYNRVFVGHNGHRSDVSAVLDENIDYLTVSQALIKGTRALTAGGFAASVQEVTDELARLYPDYKNGGLLLALPNGLFPGDPGAAWFP
ncbi:MAG: MBL fold metallo-hydrolase [Granulosicoccus sp.]